MPLLSIIIPTFNSAKTVAACLDSIVCQTFKDFEVWIIDGVSTDATLEIVKEYAAKCPFIHWISEPDKGIYDAMNKGIDLAKGEWLYFLGSDDSLYDKDVLNNVTNEICAGSFDLVYGMVEGKNSKIVYKYDSELKVFSKGIHHQSIFYKKEIFDKLGKYDLRFTIAADYHLTLKVFCNPSFIKEYIELPVATYGENGLSSSNFDYKFFSYHYKFLKIQQIKLNSTAINELLNNSIYCCLMQAKEKKDLWFSWSNLLFYVFFCYEISFVKKLKSLYNMVIWSFKAQK